MVSPNISKPPFVSLKLEGCAASCAPTVCTSIIADQHFKEIDP